MTNERDNFVDKHRMFSNSSYVESTGESMIDF